MFQKPHRIKSQTQLKGSEKKKLVAQIAQNFPSLTEVDLASILPSKADVILIKGYSAKGESINIYQIEKEPVFFKDDQSNRLYPTVYFLWKYPEILKTFTTHTAVINKLMQGADLMLPGIEISGDEVRYDSYGKFEKGKLVAINTLDNACPFAIGKTALSSMDMYMAGRQGKGVIIHHIYQDFLWEMGPKAPIPEMTFAKAIDSIEESPNDEKIANIELENVSADLKNIAMCDESITKDLEFSKSSSPEAMDELFVYCFLKALKTTAKKIELPVLTSNFYRLHMVKVCPNNQNLDVKKSTYKKLSKFLNAMVKKNIILVKEFPKGVENITTINWAHEDLKNFVVDENEASPITTPDTTNSSSSFSPPVLEELYQVSNTTIQFFKRNGANKGDVLSKSDIKTIVTSYIQKKNLKRGDKVEMDSLLHDAVVTPKEGYKEFLRWDEIFSRLLGKMSPAFRISQQGRVPIIRKGKLEPIEIAVAKRTGNKKVTLIYNVATFGIIEDEFAHQIQVGVATSTSVGPAENKPQGTTQILVQGNQVSFIAKLLLDTYCIPRKYIKGLELAIKRKN